MNAHATGQGGDGPRVVIVGGGVAGLEALMALRDLAGERVEITVVAPDLDFTYKPLAVEEPFSHQPAEARALEPVAAEFGASFVHAAVEEVATAEHRVRLSTGADLEYELLLVCVGGRPRPAFRQGTTFLATGAPLPIDALLRRAAAAPSARIAFVVPPGVTWPLPLYEVALMSRRRAEGLGLGKLEHVVVTPESAPLIMFGSQPSAEVRALLQGRRIAVETESYVREAPDGALVLSPGGRPLDAGEMVALPVIEGPGIPGLPADEQGFLPIDEHARVQGAPDVYAAGDGTSFPIKQGGIATQQADAAAEHIAARAGAPVDPQPFRPVLRGKLLTGDESLHLRHELAGGAGEGSAALDYLWWPPHKISGRYLAAWLGETTPHLDSEPPRRPIDVEVSLPREWHREPMALDPYGPLAGDEAERKA
jgi:sulfide:quinone oxidoreductase